MKLVASRRSKGRPGAPPASCAIAFSGARELAGRDALAAHRIAHFMREAAGKEEEREPELLHLSGPWRHAPSAPHETRL
jgi:hypothetical protein